jgi:large subunit ribosomal protein L35
VEREGEAQGSQTRPPESAPRKPGRPSPFPFTSAPGQPLFRPFPAMQKTRKSISKRFKVTGTGKVMRRSPNTRHLLSSKSRKQRRRANKSKRVDSGFEKKMLASMPFA